MSSSSSSAWLPFETASVSVKSELTSSPDSRLLRLPTPTVPLSTSPLPSLALQGAISSSSRPNTISNARHDVHFSVNSSASSNPAPRSFGQPSNLETSVSSRPPTTQHVITNNNKRLRTTNKVFVSTSDLAAYHGIPQILPPPPVTTSTHRAPQPAETQHQPLFDFNALKNSYLSMLATNPNEGASEDVSMVAPPPAPLPNREAQTPAPDNQRFEDLINYLASPEFKENPMLGPSFDMNQYLTSPLPELLDDFGSPDETPYNDFLSTPQLDKDYAIMSDNDYDPNQPIFPDLEDALKEDYQHHQPEAPLLDMDHLFTMSPGTPMIDTPALDPGSMYPAPRFPSTAPSTSSPATAAARRRSSATGTRKGITPESLVPIDAPTQARKYITPSATSRKELPAVFARKRARSQALGDEEDELDGERAPGPNATEKEQIEWKRRQNTLAARKSRKRKLQHQQELEDTVKVLTSEREVWKTRALTFRQLLTSHGIPFNEFQD